MTTNSVSKEQIAAKLEKFYDDLTPGRLALIDVDGLAFTVTEAVSALRTSPGGVTSGEVVTDDELKREFAKFDAAYADFKGTGSREAVAEWFAVQSVTGTHIGMWQDEDVARKVFREDYPNGELIPLVPLTQLQVVERERDELVDRLRGEIEDLAEYEGNALNERDAESTRADKLQALLDAARDALDEIGGLSRFLRQGGPDQMDLEGFWDGLNQAINLAHSAFHATAPAALTSEPRT